LAIKVAIPANTNPTIHLIGNNSARRLNSSFFKSLLVATSELSCDFLTISTKAVACLRLIPAAFNSLTNCNVSNVTAIFYVLMRH